MTDRPHVPECQCDRCCPSPAWRQPAGYDPDRPPYCAYCHQVLTWQPAYGWVLWGWAGRGVSAPRAALCHGGGSPDHLHVPGGYGSKPDLAASGRALEAAGYRFTRHADGTLSPLEVLRTGPRCVFCGHALEWKHSGWWAEDRRDGHLYCVHNPNPGPSPHVPARTSCTMGPGCDCPFHDDTPWPVLPRKPYKQLKSGARYYPRSFPVTDGPITDQVPKTVRSPLDELYASTTGRPLPADSYAGWGAEWVDTGLPSAMERMLDHVTLADPAEGFRWDAPAEPAEVAAPAPQPELVTAPDRSWLHREARVWLIALALTITGFATGLHVLAALGAVMWFSQLARQIGPRRISKDKTKDRAVEGKHAKSE